MDATIRAPGNGPPPTGAPASPPVPVQVGSRDLTDLPRRLAELHARLAVGVVVDVPDAGPSAPIPLGDVVVGAGFEPVRDRPPGGAIRARRAHSLADTVAPAMRLLVCGLNPSPLAATTGVGFAHPANRFWNAARAAGIVTADRDPWHALDVDGVGMTDLVKRTTRTASELTAGEYAAGIARLERLVAWLTPAAVCFVGLAGWRAAVDPGARPGPQPGGIAGRPVYVMPSTSGANAHARPEELAGHLRAAGELANGVPANGAPPTGIPANGASSP